jgi:hypothetical protein
MAMHLARPTKTSPVRKSLLSGKNAHARPSYDVSVKDGLSRG